MIYWNWESFNVTKIWKFIEIVMNIGTFSILFMLLFLKFYTRHQVLESGNTFPPLVIICKNMFIPNLLSWCYTLIKMYKNLSKFVEESCSMQWQTIAQELQHINVHVLRRLGFHIQTLKRELNTCNKTCQIEAEKKRAT